MGKPIPPEDCGWPDTPSQALILPKVRQAKSSRSRPNPAIVVAMRSPLGSFDSRAICGLWGTRILSLSHSQGAASNTYMYSVVVS
jgi:hypothetical protein